MRGELRGRRDERGANDVESWYGGDKDNERESLRD
jgi:hypothetical protein